MNLWVQIDTTVDNEETIKAFGKLVKLAQATGDSEPGSAAMLAPLPDPDKPKKSGKRGPAKGPTKKKALTAIKEFVEKHGEEEGKKIFKQFKVKSPKALTKDQYADVIKAFSAEPDSDDDDDDGEFFDNLDADDDDGDDE